MYKLLDTIATPNVMSSPLVKSLHLKLEQTSKVVTVANGTKIGVLAKVRDIPVSFENVVAWLDLVVLKNVPLTLVI